MSPSSIKEVTTADMAPVYHSKFTHRQVFTYEQEQKIADYCIERSRMNFGLTYALARELAYKYAVALNVNKRIPAKWHTTG